MKEEPKSVVGWVTPSLFTEGLHDTYRTLLPKRTDTHTVCVRIMPEPERYHVCEGPYHIYVVNRETGGWVCEYMVGKHPYAREAAEAECARLNAQEQE